MPDVSALPKAEAAGLRVLRCENCGRLTGTHFSALYDCASSGDSPHDFRELEVVPLARAEAAETALREAERALRAVQRNDMTRPYEYRGRGARRADGSTPTDGSRWLTPRELATIALAPRTTTTEEVTHVRTAQG